MNRQLTFTVCLALELVLGGCASSPSRTPSSTLPALRELNGSVRFFATPQDMHKTWKSAINQAKSKIVMEMFHLTDPQIVSLLRSKTGLDITLILDSGNLADPATAKIAQ